MPSVTRTVSPCTSPRVIGFATRVLFASTANTSGPSEDNFTAAIGMYSFDVAATTATGVLNVIVAAVPFVTFDDCSILIFTATLPLLGSTAPAIAEIVPDKIQYAVEMFVQPFNLPLLATGQKVRFLFDGFPAIVFSGWPKASSGTFGGEIVAVESNVSVNGKFRVLVKEDAIDKPWPKELKMGTGAQGITLLKDVAVWYELWRNINGFPPDYYMPGKNVKDYGSK